MIHFVQTQLFHQHVKQHMSKAFQDEVLYKYIIIGNSGAGKTTLLTRYIYESYTINYKSTV